MKLTVLIPYNRDRGWLQQAIDSVKNQSVPVDLILAHSDGTCADNLVKLKDKHLEKVAEVCLKFVECSDRNRNNMFFKHKNTDSFELNPGNLIYNELFFFIMLNILQYSISKSVTLIFGEN